MSSVLKMLGIEAGGFNLIFVLPVAAVLVAVNFLFKFRFCKLENTKNSQDTKKLKLTINKQKHQSSNKVKKGKIKQEKKTLLNNVQERDSSSDINLTKPNKHQTPKKEKPPKKNVNTKKPQGNVALNSTNKKSENILKSSVVNTTEEGEWQTVSKKKQKSSKPTATILNKKSEKSTEETLIIPNKKKLDTANEKNMSSTAVNGQTTSVVKDLAQTKSITEEQISDDTLFIISESNKTAAIEAIVDNDLSQPKSTVSANVAFDELGDDAWTDSKPQRKNRKKALRE